MGKCSECGMLGINSSLCAECFYEVFEQGKSEQELSNDKEKKEWFDVYRNSYSEKKKGVSPVE